MNQSFRVSVLKLALPDADLEQVQVQGGNRKRRGLGKPETIAFLGSPSSAANHAQGSFQFHRKTRRDRMRLCRLAPRH